MEKTYDASTFKDQFPFYKDFGDRSLVPFINAVYDEVLTELLTSAEDYGISQIVQAFDPAIKNGQRLFVHRGRIIVIESKMIDLAEAENEVWYFSESFTLKGEKAGYLFGQILGFIRSKGDRYFLSKAQASLRSNGRNPARLTKDLRDLLEWQITPR